MDHRPSCRNPWLPLLLLVSVVLVLLSCALHATADCSTAIGTNGEEQTDSKKGGDCHGRNHTHSHGHHDGSGGKDKPGKKPATGGSSSSSNNNNNNPWVLSAGAAPRPQLVSGFTAATGVVILITGAAVSWSLATY